MTVITHAGMAGTVATPVEVGAKHIRWGLWLFVFGYPTPAAKAGADGSTTVYFAPTKPEGVSDGNWIQTDPKKGWFTLLRLYSPLEPFFTKTWRPSEIELVTNK